MPCLSCQYRRKGVVVFDGCSGPAHEFEIAVALHHTTDGQGDHHGFKGLRKMAR